MNRVQLYIKSTIICIAAAIAALTSCVDRYLLDSIEVPEGTSTVNVSVGFKAFTPALESRASGSAIKNINSLWLVIYRADGSFVEKRRITSFTEESLSSNVRPDGQPSSEQKTGHVKFPLTIDNGYYQMYAIANHDLSAIDDDDISSPDKLKHLDLTWQSDAAGKNAQMFGWLIEGDKTDDHGKDAPIITIRNSNISLHAWVRRAASKLTVAFDTQRLNENIEIYIKSVTVKDIPTHCYLGDDNKVGADDYTLSNDLINGETLYFGAAETTTDFMQWRCLTRETAYWGYRSENAETGAPAITDAESLKKRREWEHDEAADALYFYENMQGIGKNKAQTAAGPGNNNGADHGIGYPNPDENIPGSGWKDEKPYGSYVEVEAFYVSEADGNVCQGNIKYRFMLGKNITTDYDAQRNHHYKLTLVFNGNANDVDWHIDFTRMSPVFEVSEPKTVNYQGKYFVPKENGDPNYNLGNLFEENIITIKSFTSDDNGSDPMNYTISYRPAGKSEFSATCPWMDMVEVEGNTSEFIKKWHFKFHDDYQEIDIDANLAKAKSKSTNSAAPYNLANPGNTTQTIKCTANSYMIDAPGWYIFPLVYGNAIHNGATNESAYKYEGSHDSESVLTHFVNHLNNPISDPYIRNNAGCNPVDAKLVWQDEQNLVTNISYDPSAYSNKGGIKFYVNPTTIQQGNAVIAIRDKDAAGNFRTMWSWHIWVTRLDVEEQDKLVTVSDHNSHLHELLPMNLGWCSNDNDNAPGVKNKIRYYPELTCEIKLTPNHPGAEPKIIKVVKKSHIAFPRGNNPYYQWGRKDPFIGSSTAWGNKHRWDGDGNFYGMWNGNEPPRLTPESDKDHDYEKDRKTTREALHILIQKPDTWHNPPRKWHDEWQMYVSDNHTYDNLWTGRSTAADERIYKTVYDPCPVGYQVPHRSAYTGFSTSGDNVGDPNYANNVPANLVAPGCPTDQVFEFYTDRTKLQSIVFPVNGYRDWDNKAQTLNFGGVGYAWSAGSNAWADAYCYDLEFSLSDPYSGIFYVRPVNSFFGCDGFPVRPSVYEKHGSELSELE